VISQRLLSRKDGRGRIVACEVMIVTGTIRDCILDPARTQEIPELIEEGREHYGSQSFDQHLMDLVRADLVDFEVAKANANKPSDFDLRLNVFGSSSSGMGSGGLEEPGMEQPGLEQPGMEQPGLAEEMKDMFRKR
jgi:twitching motility protein PilT